MTSSQQARQSLGNLSELFTGILGTDAATIGAETPEVPPGDRLAEEIKAAIMKESAKRRLASMAAAQQHAEKSYADYAILWATPEALEQEIIQCITRAFRYDGNHRSTGEFPTWDTDTMYSRETLAGMPSQLENIETLISNIKDYVTVEVADNVDKIMAELEADTSLFSASVGVATTASVRKSIESANTDTLAIAAAASAAANTAKMKEAASKSQHNLMVRRNTELHDLDQLCSAAEDRIIELTEFQRAARNARNQLDHSSTGFADVTEESKYDKIIERERAELILQTNKRNVKAVNMLGIATRVVRQKTDNKIFKSDDFKKIAELKIWTTDTANTDTTKQLRQLLANWATINIEEIWSIAPFIARLCETGVAGWKIPLIAQLTDGNNVAQSDETRSATELLMPHLEAFGFVSGEPTSDEITAYNTGPGGLTESKQIEDYLKAKKTYRMIQTYVQQSQKAYSELYLFLQTDIKTMCLEEGCYLELRQMKMERGSRSERSGFDVDGERGIRSSAGSFKNGVLYVNEANPLGIKEYKPHFDKKIKGVDRVKEFKGKFDKKFAKKRGKFVPRIKGGTGAKKSRR